MRIITNKFSHFSEPTIKTLNLIELHLKLNFIFINLRNESVKISKIKRESNRDKF